MCERLQTLSWKSSTVHKTREKDGDPLASSEWFKVVNRDIFRRGHWQACKAMKAFLSDGTLANRL